ncbi:retrotransposon protein, putative, ty1-copia subclass [Tanacetum coccineum]
MHTTMVPEQVKTMKIQAGVQVSRQGELRRHLQFWKCFGRLYFIVIVLDRNIKNLISQEVSGRAVELEEIQDEDTSPSENTSEIPIEVEGFEPPQEEVVPVRRSVRTHRAPDRLCLNVEVEEYSLGDLNEPTNYKAALLDLKSDKWVDAMNAEMQSMKDNQVWCLVDLPSNCKTVGSKWLFKKKTDMDGIVYTYKGRSVAKGYTQTYGVNYEETLLTLELIGFL